MTDTFHAGRIPLTVIGGFLGSGKTTLLNHMLQGNDGRRLAVLVNDFGAINIDASLVSARGADMISLANGCVCCQIGGDLTDALIRVIDSTPRPDAIVIEASGVSDPWRIAQVSLADPALALDGVVVLVDVTSVLAQAADPLLADTVDRQLRAADLLVLNQCDRADAGTLAAVRARFDAQLPDTPRFETRFGEVPVALLGGALPLATRDTSHGPHCAAGCSHTAHDHDHAPDHGAEFDTWSLTAPGVFRADALRALLRAMPPGVIRLKGVVHTDAQGLAVLQFAGRHGSLRAWPAGTPQPATTDNTLVAIGLRGRLHAAALEQSLRGSLTAR
ncbi:GTP-binding protein [Variovorax sp. dw_308]|uniref:CobW family GTP-binding protein n=1 Tax=Variovorax sp. dw_308 TaxID=2721546 RepID=UPI001C447590|nr:GTP-binding protein [Variovorax sp. dw_308]